jgi:hypothetical protein
MQPYFLPYLGYWQLMNHVNSFVIYDDIQFVKKGWIHRNRYLNQGEEKMFTLPLKKDSDYLDVVERQLSEDWESEKTRLLRKIEESYRKAPHFEEGICLFHECINSPSINLFDFLLNSIKAVANALNINSELVISSEVQPKSHLKGEQRVINLCKQLHAKEYVNPIGGRKLYQHSSFNAEGISLKFLEIEDGVVYQQLDKKFVPNLSILDVVMFNGIVGARAMLSRYSLHE